MWSTQLSHPVCPSVISYFILIYPVWLQGFRMGPVFKILLWTCEPRYCLKPTTGAEWREQPPSVRPFSLLFLLTSKMREAAVCASCRLLMNHSLAVCSWAGPRSIIHTTRVESSYWILHVKKLQALYVLFKCFFRQSEPWLFRIFSPSLNVRVWVMQSWMFTLVFPHTTTGTL